MAEAGLEVRVRREPLPPSEEELVRAAEEHEVLVTLLTDRVSRRVLEAGVKMVANYAVGYDNIDTEAARELGVVVTNTPGVLTEATAELTWALILSVARRVVEADRFTRLGHFKAWGATLFLGTELRGKTLGIVGAGRIGSRVGEIGVAFGMRILYFDRKPSETLEKLGAKRVSLQELLEASDIISAHLPLTSETLHLLDREAFERVKPGAIFVNTARGKVVDEEALVWALKSGRLAGAGLDVYYNEPEIHPELLSMPNVVLLPHIGSATREAREAMALAVAENVIAFSQGQEPPNRVV